MNEDWLEEVKQPEFFNKKYLNDKNDFCSHLNCPECHGSGRKRDGTICIHMISCQCSRCSPKM